MSPLEQSFCTKSLRIEGGASPVRMGQTRRVLPRAPPMTLTEGTIQFHCTLHPARPAHTIPPPLLAELDAWRAILRRLGVLGHDPARYDGFGFGNLSARDPNEQTAFHITATQTGALEHITARDVCRIVNWDLQEFSVQAEGALLPSSEALTHALIYAADSRVRWIFHVHDPDTWRAGAALALPLIPPDVAYGSPAMAQSVAKLLTSVRSRPIVFGTLGHEDGVFACGDTARDTGCALLATLAQALARR